MDQRFLFRCDAGRVAEIGTGHARRAALVASELQRAVGGTSRFLMRDLPGGPELVRRQGLDVDLLRPGETEAQALRRVLGEFRPHIVVFDNLDTSADAIAACREAGVVVVTLDDRGAGLKEADIVINAIREVPTEDPGALLQGPDYIVLPAFDPPPLAPPRAGPLTAFLSFGGYDHHRILQLALEAVARVPAIGKVILVGAAAPAERPGAFEIEAHVETSEFPALLASADVAIVAGGLTMFEAMRSGVPAIVVAQYPHQEETAARYEARGAVLNLGQPGPDVEARLARALERLAADPAGRGAMAEQGRRLVDGKGLRRVAEAVAVCQFLEWDTKFFGRSIAQVNVSRLSPAILRHVVESCQRWGVECLYYLADCHHRDSVQLAEAAGFHFVDIRLTFEHDLRGVPGPAREGGGAVRPARPGDVPHLRAIARTSYTKSRYYFDARFSQERCETFYTEWVEKCCRGFADHVLVAEADRRPAGYVTCSMRRPHLGIIDLVGIAEEARGRGVGRHLVAEALAWFKARGAESVEVVTQGRNYDAQRLYQRCGFTTKSTQLWYHKWFSPPVARPPDPPR